jgi:ABC-type lipoprotein release transport system permease subunit
MEPILTWEAILTATALGIIVPIASAIFPIRHALSQNLHDSLDTKRAKVQAISVDLERSEDKSFSWSLLVIGISLSIFGFAVYYVMPLSLLTLNFTLLLNIFFFILMGMLFGLVLLSLNAEPLLERLLVQVLFWWEKAAIRSIVVKNLIAHRKRNRKTTIMYALSLGFIIFVMVSYSSILDGFAYQREQKAGVILKVIAQGTDDFDTQEYRHSIHNIEGLEKVIEDNPHWIKRHAWLTHGYDYVFKTHSGPELNNLGRTFSDNQRMFGISPSLLQVVFPGFLKISQGSESIRGMDLAEQLYTVDGSSRAWVGSFYKSSMGVKDLNTRMLWRFYGTKNPSATNTAEVNDLGGGGDDRGGGSDPGRGGGGGGSGGGGSFGGGGNVPGGGMPVSPTAVGNRNADSYENRVLMKPLALLDAAPLFRMSSFTMHYQDTIVSLPTWLRNAIETGILTSVEDIPMGQLLLELTSNDGGVREAVKAALNNIINGQAGVSIRDMDSSSNPIEKAEDILTYFFAFTTLIAMLIASFSLVSSMYTNIYEQTKEIGILRAIGIEKGWLRRIYLYEAFVLVLASSLLGVMIGSVVGYTMLLQRILFTQLPLPFRFPWIILIVVSIGSLLFAFVSSFGPITSVMKRSVVNILRFA